MGSALSAPEPADPSPLAVGGQGSCPAVADKGSHEVACFFSLSGMLRKLDIKNEDDVKSFSRVMVHVFKDGVTNWGRIVTLISFGAYVAKHLKSINQENCIEPLAESITDVLVRSKRDWLVKQRGWVSLPYGLKGPWSGNGVQDFVKVEAAKGFYKAPGSRSNLCTSA